MGGGAVAVVFAVSLFSPRLVPPLATARRLAAGAAAAPHRAPRPRERPAQPQPHRGHRGGADDRPRPGRLRHRLRRRAEEHGRPGRRRKLRRRPGDPEHRRLLADPERRRRRPPSRCPGSSWWRRSAAPKRRCSNATGRERRRGSTRRRPNIGETVNIEWKQGGPAALRDLARRRGDRLRRLRRLNGLELGDRFRLLTQTRATPELPRRRRVRLQARRARQRPRHPAGDGPRLRPDPGHDRLRQGRRRAPTPTRSRRC